MTILFFKRVECKSDDVFVPPHLPQGKLIGDSMGEAVAKQRKGVSSIIIVSRPAALPNELSVINQDVVEGKRVHRTSSPFFVILKSNGIPQPPQNSETSGC